MPVSGWDVYLEAKEYDTLKSVELPPLDINADDKWQAVEMLGWEDAKARSIWSTEKALQHLNCRERQLIAVTAKIKQLEQSLRVEVDTAKKAEAIAAAKIKQLQDQASIDSWTINPERMGR